MNRVAPRSSAVGLTNEATGASRSRTHWFVPAASFVSPAPAFSRRATRFVVTDAASLNHVRSRPASALLEYTHRLLRSSVVNFVLFVPFDTLCVFSPHVVASWHLRYLSGESHGVQSSRVRSVAHDSRCLVVVSFASRATGSASLSEPLRRDAMAQHRAVSRRANEGGGGSSEPTVHLLHRHGEWRRVEDDRCRAHLEANLRGSTHRIHRMGRRRAVGSQHRLRRQRRRPASARPRRRRRHLQVDRCRQDLDAPRSSRYAADSQDCRRSRRIRTASSSPRSGIRTGPTRSAGIFRSTDGGKTFDRVLFKDENTGGKDVDIDPSNPSIVYATIWEAAAGPVGERRVGRHEWRPVQVD